MGMSSKERSSDFPEINLEVLSLVLEVSRILEELLLFVGLDFLSSDELDVFSFFRSRLDVLGLDVLGGSDFFPFVSIAEVDLDTEPLVKV